MRSSKVIAVFICIISLILVSIYADDSKITYSKSTQIILNTSSAGANVKDDLKGLAVLVKLDKSNFDFDVIKEDLAGNISFFSTSDGSFLSYKIQTWDKTNKTAEIWIIVPKVNGNNNSQSITMSWGKNKESITDQKLKDRIESKESHEISNATSLNTESSLFKSSYNLYGVWSSNGENGFNIIGNTSGM